MRYTMIYGCFLGASGWLTPKRSSGWRQDRFQAPHALPVAGGVHPASGARGGHRHGGGRHRWAGDGVQQFSVWLPP